MFVPSILPYEALLAPIAADAPAGTDVRWETDDLDQIAKAAGPRWAASARSVTDDVWVTKEDNGADWGKVVSLSLEVLTKRSKDLVVTVRLVEGLTVRHGIAGLHEGLWLCRELIERYWDHLFPAAEDGDLEDRAQAFVFLNEQAWRIADLEVPSGLEPWSELEQRLASANGAREEFLALYEVLQQKFGRDVPPVGRLNDYLGKYVEGVNDIVERVRPTVAPEEEPSADPSVTPEVGEVARRPVVRSRGPVMTTEPTDVQDALDRLLNLSVYLRRQTPHSLLPYRLSRLCHWVEVRESASSLQQSDIPAPPTEQRVLLRDLEAAGSWEDLLHAAEDVVASPVGRFWLDPHRAAVVAMENLGEEFAACAEAIRQDLRCLVGDFREAPQLMLSDFTAAAAPETTSWLNRNVLTGGAAQARTSTLTSDNTSDHTPSAWSEAQVLARSGRLVDAIELIRGEIGKASSKRDAFEWKLRLAEVCLAEGMSRIALPLLEGLVEEIDRFHLEEWEPKELSARVFGALYDCYQSERASGVSADFDESRMRDSFARLCRLDVARALRNGNG